jgi:GT2 family glycosyltransferase
MKLIWLWVPACDGPMWQGVDSWFQTRLPDGYGLTFRHTGPDGDGMGGAWNRLVEAFLKSGDEWLFSCHNDITYVPLTLVRLLSWGKPLVSALHFHRLPPHGPLVYRGETKPHNYRIQFDEIREWLLTHQEIVRPGPAMLETATEDALVPIDFTSTGCVLIHRSVLAAIEPPWFVYEYPIGGEDRAFFEKAKTAGFQPYIDRSVIAGHGTPPAGAMNWLAWDKSSTYLEEEK